MAIRDLNKTPRAASILDAFGEEVVASESSRNLLRRNRSHAARSARSVTGCALPPTPSEWQETARSQERAVATQVKSPEIMPETATVGPSESPEADLSTANRILSGFQSVAVRMDKF